MEITKKTKEILIGSALMVTGVFLGYKKSKRKSSGLADKVKADGKKYKNAIKSNKKKIEFLADEFPGLVNNAGEPANHGRLESYWNQHKVQLARLTNAPAFDMNVQLNPNKFIEYFGFKGVEFGNWMNQEDRVQFMFAAAGGFKALADMLELPYKYIGLNKTLTVSFGARGRGGLAVAHYEPSHKAINITKPNVAFGALAHEYSHAIDNAIGEKLGMKFIPSHPDNQYTIAKSIFPDKINKGGFFALAESIFEKLYWDNNKLNEFAELLTKTSTDYWQRRIEVFARTCEVWLSQLSKSYKNSMFVKSKYENKYYPSFKLVDPIAPLLKKLWSQGIRLVNGEKVNIDSANVDTPRKIKIAKEQKTDIKTSKFAFGDEIEIETSSETIKGNYALADLDNLIASHNYSNFNRNDKYPKGCQEREYHSNKQLQINVKQRASNLKPLHLLNEDQTAESGPSIVNKDGIVLGGNSRVMILQTVAYEKTYKNQWENYQSQLKKRLPNYGINEDDYKQYKNPVLVRLVNVNMDRCSHYSWILNTSTKNEENVTGRAIAYAKDIDDKTIQELGEYLEKTEVETLSQIFNTQETKQKIIKSLRSAGVINDSNYSKWITNNEFTAEAKLIIEAMFIGIVLTNKQLIESAKNYTDKIIKAIPYLLRIKAQNKTWNIIPNIENAIKAESDRRSQNMKKVDYLDSQSMFGDKLSKRDVLVWDLLDLKPLEFKKAVKKYVEIADEQTDDSPAMFEKKAINTDEALKYVLGYDKTLSDKFKRRKR